MDEDLSTLSRHPHLDVPLHTSPAPPTPSPSQKFTLDVGHGLTPKSLPTPWTLPVLLFHFFVGVRSGLPRSTLRPEDFDL